MCMLLFILLGFKKVNLSCSYLYLYPLKMEASDFHPKKKKMLEASAH